MAIDTISRALSGQASTAAKQAKETADSAMEQAIAAVPGAVSDWLEDNVTPTTPVVDASLSIAGAAADAKATGDGIANLKSAFEIHSEVLETAFASGYGTSITLTEAKSINADGTLYNSSDVSFKHSKLIAVKPGNAYAYSFECRENFNFRVLGYTSEATDIEYSSVPFVKMLDFQVPTVNSVNRGTFVVDDPSIAYVRFSGRTSPTEFMIGGKIDYMGDFLDGSISDMISNAISEDYASASLWEQGTYNGQTPGPSTIRLRTIDYFTSDVFQSVHVLSGYEILIIAWNKTTGAYVGTWGANGTAFVTKGASTYVLDFDFTRFPDYKFKACFRNKNNTSATIIPAEGVNSVFRKIKFAMTDSEIHSHASYTRLYSDITSDLVWQNKTITTEGISDSSTEVIAQLPSSGNVEIRMRRNVEDSQFSIWQKVGDTITMMCDWTHYQYRYTGVYSPEYYVRVKTEATSNRDFVLKHCTVAYKYCDQGENKDKQTRMFGKKVAVFGDSIVQGKVRKNQATDVNSLTCKPWSSLIGEVNGDFNPHNFGIGGATVANTGTTAYPDWKSLYTRCNEITGFDIVIICAGINDYGARVTESAFRTAYAAVLDALIANNTQVVVATLCARSTNTANSAGLKPSDYAAIEKEIAAAKSLTVIDLYAGTDNAEYKAQLPDGLHPNEIGHQIIANLVLSGY